MFNRKNMALIPAMVLFFVAGGFAQSLEEHWNDFLHYAGVGQLELAKGHAQAVLDIEPDPVDLLLLSEANPEGYALLDRAIKTPHDPQLAELSEKLFGIIEQGRFNRRTNPKIIVQEIRRLSTTARGRLAAVRRLKNAGEYAIPYMLDAMADPARKEELANVIWALPQIGRDAIRPLTAALQTNNAAIKAEIIKALGKIEYPQALAYLKFIVEKQESEQLRSLAGEGIARIDPGATNVTAAVLFYQLGENYYYHAQSLTPAEDADFANVWFWDSDNERLVSEKVDKDYFFELMTMRACEWSLKADPGFGRAIGLWQAAFFKAESSGVEMPEYFGAGHADAFVYATTAGPEYLHQALARAVKDGDAYVALGAVEALATVGGEKSLLYRIGTVQPLVQALRFDDRTVKYSAAIAIAAAGPKEKFDESSWVIENLIEALEQTAGNAGEDSNAWNGQLADSYALRAASVMLELAQTQNLVIDLSAAQSALINATKDERGEIQVLTGRILAYLDSPDAQRSIAAMALAENNDINIRISAFGSLAISAKFNANLLDVDTIDTIYSLVSSTEVEPQLRSAAASAYGSLNLPSRKVKDLILDQSRS